MHRVLERQLRKLGIGDEPPGEEQWRRFLERVDCAYVDADRDRYTLERALDLSSAEMRKRFSELREAQKRLVEASRKAGMADVATSVLHNIGNVLNSVNISTNLVSDIARSTSRAGLGKCLTLLKSQPEPGQFIDHDPRGKKLIPYLTALDNTLSEEKASMLKELESLLKNVEHIKIIVSQQLAAAKGGSQDAKIVEKLALDDLLHDATSVVKASLKSPNAVCFHREHETLSIETDRHKLFQIVLNLMANARDAIGSRESPGTIVVGARRQADDTIAIEVSDDGIGIAQETIDRIFSHGFTTKVDGHGFGLHSSACSAMELGGNLSARSEGLGCGATFTLVLPQTRLASRSLMRRTASHHAKELA
jgi:signal transduction histidine kinase